MHNTVIIQSQISLFYRGTKSQKVEAVILQRIETPVEKKKSRSSEVSRSFHAQLMGPQVAKFSFSGFLKISCLSHSGV